MRLHAPVLGLAIVVVLAGCVRPPDESPPDAHSEAAWYTDEDLEGLPSPIHNVTILPLQGPRAGVQLNTGGANSAHFMDEGRIGVTRAPVYSIIDARNGSTIANAAPSGMAFVGFSDDGVYVARNTNHTVEIHLFEWGSSHGRRVWESRVGCSIGGAGAIDVGSRFVAVPLVCEAIEPTPAGGNSVLYIIDLGNGTSRRVARGTDPSFDRDVAVAFASAGALKRAPVAGGDVKTLKAKPQDRILDHAPSVLRGDALYYLEVSLVYVPERRDGDDGPVPRWESDTPEIWRLNLTTGETDLLVRTKTYGIAYFDVSPSQDRLALVLGRPI